MIDGDLHDRATKQCAFFGEKARFHHVGLGVRSIEAVSPDSQIIPDEAAGVSMAFIDLGGITIELLEPLGENSPIERSVRDGNKLLHLAYEVPDLEEGLKTCRSAGFHRLRSPMRIQVYGNNRVVWVFSRNYGLFELIEQPEQA